MVVVFVDIYLNKQSQFYVVLNYKVLDLNMKIEIKFYCSISVLLGEKQHYTVFNS